MSNKLVKVNNEKRIITEKLYEENDEARVALS